MRALKKILKGLGLVALSLLALVIVLLGALWLHPEFLLNEARVRQALHYAPADLKVSWKGFRWDFSRTGFLAKRSDLELKDFCFTYGKEYEGCLPEFHLDLTFAFHGLLPSITRIDAAELHAAKIELRPGPPKAKKPSPTGPLPDLRAPAFADYYPALLEPETIGRVSVHVDELRMQSAEGPPLVARAALEKDSEAGLRDVRFNVDAHATQGETLDVSVKGAAHIPAGEPALAFEGKITGAAGAGRFDVPLTLRWKKDVALEAQPDYRSAGSRYATEVRLRWNQDHLQLETGSLTLGQPMKDRRLELRRCAVDSDLAPKGHPDLTKFSCTFSLQARAGTKILPSVESTIFGEAKLKPKDQNVIHADVTLKERGARPLLPSHMDASLTGEYNVTDDKLLGTPKLSFNLHLGTENLQLWEPLLKGTPYSIPAPVNVLAGPIGLDVDLDHVDGRKEIQLKTKITTDLTGGNQSLITRGDATVRVAEPFTEKREIFVNGKYTLNNVQVVAPPLSLGIPPNAVPDSRFVTAAELKARRAVRRAAKANPGLPLHWNLSVTNEQPVRVVTNLLPNPIPLSVNLQLDEKGGMVGNVQVLPMPLKLFSKLAEVQRLNVIFLPQSQQPALDGLIVNRTPDVEIRVLLLGSTDAPRVDFESDPPLERDQIVQMLLFNKTLAEVQKQQIDDADAASASNVSRAMSEKAFGLFSLFFLSSTPIQSVAYDPGSQTYSIQFKLGSKTSLAVGSNFGGSRQVQLRRSLGGPWAIRTELDQTEQTPNRLLTFLEWFRRF